MNSQQLKKQIRQTFGLKKPWFGDDPVMCRDGDYPNVNADIYKHIDQKVWAEIERRQVSYQAGFPDCDDFADIKLGLFKLEWWDMIKQSQIPWGTPPSYGVCDGYNPERQLHDFNLFVSGGIIFISDYGRIVAPGGYQPLKVRF
jgi:hypothetical protein